MAGVARHLKWIDLPPLWTAAAILSVWLWRGIGPRVTGAPWDVMGVALIAFALGLMVWAVATMTRARTTVVPHLAPVALVTGGPFRFSRNPIYFGDVLVFVGAVFWIGSILGLVLVPVLVAVLTRRYILPEETRLRAAFGPAFDAWAARVRRWL